jgi:hypothetical protein
MRHLLSLLAAAWAFVACLLGAPGLAAAHALDLTTARVSLRDGLVDVTCEVDVVAMVARAAGGGADATALATAGDDELARLVATARGALEAGAGLEVDSTSVPLVLRAFPTPTEVRFLAAHASASPSAHPAASAVRLEAARAVAGARAVRVVLPASLGRVLYTFVQPETRLANAGAAASFEAGGPAPPVAAPEPSRPWLGVAAFALAGLALVVQLAPRRRSPTAA